LTVAELIERLERSAPDLRVLATYDCECAEGDVVETRLAKDFDDLGPVMRLIID
jgi:hypothetical protein